METIRQNGKTILYSNDGISIKMVFKNLYGQEFSRSGICRLYPAHRNRAAWDFHPVLSSIAGTVRLQAKGQSRMYESCKLR